MKKRLMGSAAALLLGLASAFAICAQAEEDPVLFWFEGEAILQSEVVSRTAAYAQLGAISSETAYEEAIEYMIEDQLVPQAKAQELGLDEYTDEEMQQMKEAAQEYFEEQLEAYVEYFVGEQSEEEKEEFRQQLEEYWASMGTDVQAAEESYIFDQTKKRLLATMEVEVSEEEIEQTFEEQVAKDEAYFADNIAAFEYYTYYQNSDIWYVPAGFRGVQQILLTVEEELTDAYEQAVEDNTDGTGEAAVEEAAAAVLAAKEDVIEEIYARLEDGEAFADLMKEYSEDSSLTEDAQEGGYMVHPESTVWGDEFTQAAFSDKMQEPGDVSDPVVSEYGIHILYYLRDIPEGPVELNDRIKESISSYLTNQKYLEIIRSWVDEYQIEYNQDAIDALNAAAAAQE